MDHGIAGVLDKIEKSRSQLKKEMGDYEKKFHFLTAAKISMEAFAGLIGRYGKAAQEQTVPEEYRQQRRQMVQACERLSDGLPPENFYEALTLVWFCYLAFVYEGRYAMAFGRMDQYLWPFYQRDVAAGLLTKEEATDLVAHTLYKIGEWRLLTGGDDVSNIAIAGVDRRGKDACNDCPL